MFNRQTIVRSTLATALLSALVLSQGAHAGLLGGGGGLAGGLGGSLGGGFGPRSLDVAGAAAGQFARHGDTLARGEGAARAAGEIDRNGTHVGQSTLANATGARSLDRAGTVKPPFIGSDVEQASTARGRGGNLVGVAAAHAHASRGAVQPSLAAGTTSLAGSATDVASATPQGFAVSPVQSTAGGGAASNGNRGGTAAGPGADASANGSARASRASRSMSTDASAQGSVHR